MGSSASPEFVASRVRLASYWGGSGTNAADRQCHSQFWAVLSRFQTPPVFWPRTRSCIPGLCYGPRRCTAAPDNSRRIRVRAEFALCFPRWKSCRSSRQRRRCAGSNGGWAAPTPSRYAIRRCTAALGERPRHIVYRKTWGDLLPRVASERPDWHQDSLEDLQSLGRGRRGGSCVSSAGG